MCVCLVNKSTVPRANEQQTPAHPHLYVCMYCLVHDCCLLFFVSCFSYVTNLRGHWAVQKINMFSVVFHFNFIYVYNTPIQTDCIKKKGIKLGNQAILH